MAGITGRRRKVASETSTSTSALELQPLRNGSNAQQLNNNNNNNAPSSTHDDNGNNLDTDNDVDNNNNGINNNGNGYYGNNNNGTTTNTNNNGVSKYSSPASAAAKGSNRFNPRLIFSQIVAIQSIHYLVLSFLFQIDYVLFGTKITIDRIFTGNYLDIWTARGWIDNGAVLTSSVFGAFLLAFVVEKSKKCLDFSVTLFTIHLALSSLYDGGIPRTWDWWIIHVLGMLVMILVGEYLCSRVEMREIPLLLL